MRENEDNAEKMLTQARVAKLLGLGRWVCEIKVKKRMWRGRLARCRGSVPLPPRMRGQDAHPPAGETPALHPGGLPFHFCVAHTGPVPPWNPDNVSHWLFVAAGETISSQVALAWAFMPATNMKSGQ